MVFFWGEGPFLFVFKFFYLKGSKTFFLAGGVQKSREVRGGGDTSTFGSGATKNIGATIGFIVLFAVVLWFINIFFY